ncbi:hypothetical protein [Bartonella sp. HY761]|uniref:hypothetical protein n=1 Tax=Bartonella sp. HY761 TaxID=2979330 RepID=UPI0021E2F0D9|nr:hypothetical protein [Bartonella sp. HY761]UXN07984.1 hypothetical protein N6A79_15365 [Bartonella sp. HY761]
MKWLTLSTNKGNDKAMAHLGLITLNKFEGKLNPQENAYSLFKRGAEQGSGQAEPV